MLRSSLTMAVLLGMLGGHGATAGSYIWIEGEALARTNVQGQATGWGDAHHLSGDQWYLLAIPEGQVAQRVPDEGIRIVYEFEATETGPYTVWHRVGYETVRPDYDWRVNDGPWQRVDAVEDLTIDLMAIADWAEVAWLQAGQVMLDAGRHTIEFRIERPYKDEAQRQPDRIQFALDAICLCRERFIPNGRHKPDEDWQSDEDRRAASHVFAMPEPSGRQRTELELFGLWQLARFDEPGHVEDRTGPIPAVPEAEELIWSAITVPGDRHVLRPEWRLCHRYLYRTRVDVPADYAGHAMILAFDEVAMLATVFVNGQQVAFHDATHTGFQVDVSDAIRPGQVNEIWVGIKDAYYAVMPEDRHRGQTRYVFNTPPQIFMGTHAFTMRLDFPVWGQLRNGLTDRVRLIATGPVYADDVFARPSVADSSLGLDITLRNPTDAPMTVTVVNAVEPLEGGEAEKAFESTTVEVPAGDRTTVSLRENWDNPKLWWPDDPQQYHVVTTILDGDRILDVKRTKFGFREWSIQGTRFVLNGIPWQLRANLDFNGAHPGDLDDALARWAESGQTMFRLRQQHPWGGMTQREALDWFDAQGIPIRRAASTFDGQHASYKLVLSSERVGRDVHKTINAGLFDNWRKQLAARIVQQRNHPSIFMWELDNEIIFINARNRGDLDVVEPQFKQAAELVQSLDPTGRAVSVAGGRALADQSLPVNGSHYEAANTREYPDMAYGLGEWTHTHSHQPWPMAMDKPIFLSEEFFAHGYKPDWFAAIGGEVCFSGTVECRPAIGLLARMYSEGYRWQELGGFHFWFSQLSRDYEIAWQPVAALVRQWSHTFASGATVPRTVMVRNDTRFDSPIELRWQVQVDGRTIDEGRRQLRINPGHGQIVDLSFDMPSVTDRAQGVFHLACWRDGQEVWRDAKPFSVINPDIAAEFPAPPGRIIVLDPQGPVKRRLDQLGIAFESIEGLDALPETFDLLILGPDAVSRAESTSDRWYRLAQSGRRMLVLDQRYPLSYRATAADMEPSRYTGRIAFSQNLNHPIFAGIEQQDLAFWTDDHVVYRHAYSKPTHSGQSLVQCDESLNYSALVIGEIEQGLQVLCQLAVGSKLDSHPVAQRLFDNLLRFSLTHDPARRDGVVVLPEDDPRRRLIQATGAIMHRGDDLAAAMTDPAHGVIVADGSRENLQQLLELSEQRQAFFERGGYLMLCNVPADALAGFNRLVGYDHIMRDSAREMVAVRLPRHPMAAGISQSDLRMTGERIAQHFATEWVIDDMFTGVVDLDEIVPFLDGPGIEPDHNGGSIANGFTDAEFWRYVHYIGYGTDRAGPPTQKFRLPRPETIRGVSIVPTTHYQKAGGFQLTFHTAGDQTVVRRFDLAPHERADNPRQDFDVRVENVVAFDFDFVDIMPHERRILGIDNLWVHLERDADYHAKVQPLLNIGGIVFYPQGKGGIVLNQLNVKAREAKPDHATKKQAVFAALLRNMGANFPGKQVILPGDGLTYSPISLEGKCNVYVTAEQGWPFDRHRDLRHLPLGRQRLGGVMFDIRDFRTSPLEHAIGLGDRAGLPNEVHGIVVNQQADALFVLHAAVGGQAQRWFEDRRIQQRAPNQTVVTYTIEYVDGEQLTVPVGLNRGIHRLTRTDEPVGMAEATVAWAAPFDRDQPEELAVLYAWQWDNPRPQVAIRQIQAHAHSRGYWGHPLIVGITAAQRKE